METYFFPYFADTNAYGIYPSSLFFNFSEQSYDPMFYYKVATDAEALSESYGWNHTKSVKNNELTLMAEEFHYPRIPNIPNINEVTVSGNTIHLEFESMDLDDDILGYMIYVSKKSRGWEYLSKYCDESVNKYVVNRYEPEQYDKITVMPPSEVLKDKIEKSYYDLTLPKGKYYISIMPYDRYGEDIGKEWYLPSNELMIEIEGE